MKFPNKNRLYWGVMFLVGLSFAMSVISAGPKADASFDVAEESESPIVHQPTTRFSDDLSSDDIVQCSSDLDAVGEDALTDPNPQPRGGSTEVEPRFWRCCEYGYYWRLKWYYDNDCQCKVYYWEKVRYCKRKSNAIGIC